MRHTAKRVISGIMAFMLMVSLVATAPFTGQVKVMAEETGAFTLYYYDSSESVEGVYLQPWDKAVNIKMAENAAKENVQVDNWSADMYVLESVEGYDNLFSITMQITGGADEDGFGIYVGNPGTRIASYGYKWEDATSYGTMMSGESDAYVIRGGQLYTSLEAAGVEANEPEEGYSIKVKATETEVDTGSTVSLTATVKKDGKKITDLNEAGLKLWWWTDIWQEGHEDGLTDVTFSNYDNNSGLSLTADATLNTDGTYYIAAQIQGDGVDQTVFVTLKAIASVKPVEGAEIGVSRVNGLSDDFLMGMDISSVISEFDSGVTYKDYEGNTIDNVDDFCAFLATNGVNSIRVRIWNDPYDAQGNGYGGGNNDVAKARIIADACRKAGIKMLADFHCSDFWADPGKYQAPKAWADYTVEQKADAVKAFIEESLNTIDPQKDTVTMVQVGNETTGGFIGENNVADMCTLFKAGVAGVRAYNEAVKAVIHVTNPEKGRMTQWAKNLSDNEVDYDVLATSYYPYWHGTLDNLKAQMTSVKNDYGKDVMVAETSFAHTLEDSDGHADTVRVGNNDTGLNYPFTVQGQANSVRDVIATVSEAGGLGVYYWEPAWITVGDVTGLTGEEYDAKVAENKAKWEKYGSGWASSYANEYDPKDAGVWYGGSPIDNEAMFDRTGAPLASLNVWNYVKTGAISKYTTVDEIKDAELTLIYGEPAALPDKIRVTYSSGVVDENVTWDENDVKAIDTKKPGQYIVKGIIALTVAVNQGEYSGKDTAPVTCVVTVLPENLLPNGGFEDAQGDWVIEGTGWKVNGEDKHTGNYALHFWEAEAFSYTATQKVTLNAGKYQFGGLLYGGASGESDVYEVGVTVGDKTVTKASALSGSWTDVKTDEFVVEKDQTQVTVQVRVVATAGAWGSWDDMYIYRTGDYVPTPPDTNSGNNNNNNNNNNTNNNVNTNPISTPKVEIGKVTVARTSLTYNGKAQKPAVTVYDKNGNKIAASAYTVAYSNNKNVGTAKVTVTLTSDQSTATAAFKILPKKAAIAKKATKKKGWKITWKKVSGVSGYEVQYSTSKSFAKKATVTKKVKASKTALTVTGLKASKKYYIRIRTYKKVSGKTYASAWSAVKNIKTKK